MTMKNTIKKIAILSITVAISATCFIGGAFYGKSEDVKAIYDVVEQEQVESVEEITEELESVEAETDALYEEPKEGSLEFYRKIASEADLIGIIPTDELDYDDLITRNGKLIIEECIGTVIDEDGNGETMDAMDDDHFYINYNGHVEDFKVGDVILTYCIYNPDTNAEDDILLRFDYLIDRPEN